MADLNDDTNTGTVEYADAMDETTDRTAVPLGPETRAIIILGRE